MVDDFMRRESSWHCLMEHDSSSEVDMTSDQNRIWINLQIQLQLTELTIQKNMRSMLNNATGTKPAKSRLGNVRTDDQVLFDKWIASKTTTITKKQVEGKFIDRNDSKDVEPVTTYNFVRILVNKLEKHLWIHETIRYLILRNYSFWWE